MQTNHTADIIDLSERYRRHEGETSADVIAQYVTTPEPPAWVEYAFWASLAGIWFAGILGICLALAG